MGKIEVSLLRLLVGVLFVSSLRKYVQSLIESILGSGKGFVEGKIFDLVLEHKNGAPLGRDLV